MEIKVGTLQLILPALEVKVGLLGLKIPINKPAVDTAKEEIIMAKQKAKPATKKTATAAQKKPTAKAKTTTAKKATATAKSKTAKGAKENDSSGLHYLIDQITFLMQSFVQNHDSDSALTGTERMRLIGAGVRNYGFIEKAWDIVRENPEFIPANFNAEEFQQNIQMLDDYRQLHWVLEKFLQAANEAMLIRADASFRNALFVYRNLQAQARARVHGAQPLFMALLRFFRRRRPAEELEETEPTMKQLEKDFNKLVHGHADGEIVIKNEQPRIAKGKRTIVDDVHTDKAMIKETAEAEISE